MMTTWLVITSLPAFAGWKEDYRAALNAGNQPRALQVVQDAISRGDAEAEFTLGLLYHAGQSLPRDDEQGYAWMLVGVENGFKRGEAAAAQVEKQLSTGQRDRAKGIANGIRARRHKPR
jgi:hypothetical protein